MSAETALVLIKLLHTIVWGAMVGVLATIPRFVIQRRWRATILLLSVIFAECVVLAVNHMRCPLTDVAARFTLDRSPNFDIYLPRWLAANNKLIFGTLFAVELLWIALVRTLRRIH